MGRMGEAMGEFGSSESLLERRIGELRGVAADVGGRAAEVAQRSAEVSDRVTRASGLSRVNADAIAEMASGARQAGAAIAGLSGSAPRLSAAADLRSSVGRFRTIDAGSLKASDGKASSNGRAARSRCRPLPRTSLPIPRATSGTGIPTSTRAGTRPAPAGIELRRGGGEEGRLRPHGRPPLHDRLSPRDGEVARIFGVGLSFSSSGFDPEQELSRVREAVSSRPDLIVILAASATGGPRSVSVAYRAGIPVIYSNSIPDSECFRYCLAWTGPDDWAQTPALSRPALRGAHGGRGRLRDRAACAGFESLLFADLRLRDGAGQDRPADVLSREGPYPLRPQDDRRGRGGMARPPGRLPQGYLLGRRRAGSARHSRRPRTAGRGGAT